MLYEKLIHMKTQQSPSEFKEFTNKMKNEKLSVTVAHGCFSLHDTKTTRISAIYL